MTVQRIAASIEDLRGLAPGVERASTLRLPGPRGPVLVDPVEYSRHIAPFGTQEFVNLADDLLVVCTNLDRFPASPGLRWDYDMRGWLYLHFRLDGVSIEESAGGVREKLEDGCFFISASSQHRAHAREVLSPVWRTVGIACRPSFAMRELVLRSDRLPSELRRFHSGDADIDFWFASTLTADMRDVIKAMFRPSFHPSIRPVYLRAKTLELICLALQRLHEPELAPGALKLSLRDVECLREARRLLCESNPLPSLQQLAQHVGINRRKLALGFKQVFGMTVGDYAREHRLDRAHELLERGISVGYAAAVAGYADAGSFTKAFMARYGALPSHMRGTDSLLLTPRGKK
jgi:AraC-like DNA-binding protein